MNAAATTTNRKDTLVLVEQPWARVKDPVPIPTAGDLGAELRRLGAVEFAQLVRSNLVPRLDQPDGRVRWSDLWATIDRDPDLAEQTFDVLEDFLDACEEAASDTTLSDQQRQRAVKFRRFCDDAWQRLQNVPDAAEPLAWAGRAARPFNPPARRVLSALVDAVAAHRESVQESGDTRPVDEQLWAALRQVGLDPARARR